MSTTSSNFITVSDGTRLRVADTGGDGQTIVLVHGWKQSHRLFDQVVQRLRSQFRVIAYDQRGMGESDKPLAALAELTFDLLAGDLSDVMQQLDATEVTLVGWSMGCTTTLSLLQQPHPRVERVMLVNGPLRLTRTEDFPWALEAHELAGYVEGMEDAWPTDQRDFLAASLLPDHRGITPLLEHVAWQTPLPWALGLVRAQMKVDHRPTIRKLSVPVLAAYSRRDPYWPWELAEWIAATAPQGRCHAFEQSAHCAPLEEPVTFCEVVRAFAREGAPSRG